MTMAFADLTCAVVNIARQRAFRQTTYPRPEAHRAAHLFNVHQIAQLENNWIRRLDVEFGRIGVLQVTRVARELNAGRLHAETNPKVRRASFARIRNRANHAFNTALAESAGHQDGVKVAQARLE